MTASPAPGAGPDSPEPPWTPPRNAAAWAKSTSQTLARGSAVRLGAAAADHGGLVAAQGQQPVDVGVAAQALDAPGGLVALGDRR